jgi:MoaA/NifB/PqqE/SkfB family radical SAM enzyme
MTQDAIKEFPEISRFFEQHGLILIPKVIRCVRKGKRFPLPYTPEQKLLINEYLEEAEKKYLKVLNTMKESPTILFSDFRFIDDLPDFRGRLCSAGQKFVRIAPNGTVFRCSTSEVHGNILFRDVKFLHAPEPCNTSYSPYWCFKYLVEDEHGNKVSYDTYKKYNTRRSQQIKGMLTMVSYMLRTGDGNEILRKSMVKVKKRVLSPKNKIS